VLSGDFNDSLHYGFDGITLLNSKYMMFQGEPLEDENHCEAIEAD